MSVIMVRSLLLLILGLAAADAALAKDTEGESARVVILNATDPYLPAFLALDSALRETIRADSRAPVELFAETLDMHRFEKTRFEDELVALLKKNITICA